MLDEEFTFSHTHHHAVGRHMITLLNLGGCDTFFRMRVLLGPVSNN